MLRAPCSVLGPTKSVQAWIKGKIWFFILSASFFLIPTITFAAILPYSAAVSSAETTIQAGTSQKITLKFKNTGTETWKRGLATTELYLYGDQSIFKHSSWFKDDIPVLLNETSIAPGQMATAVFWITAPKKLGTYTERFLLSSAPNNWIKGSVVTVTIRVVQTVAAAAPVTAANSTEWKGELVDRGGTEWQLDPGGHTIVTLAFRNMGTKTWAKEGSFPLWLITQDARKSVFKDFSWKTEAQAALLTEPTVPPGAIGHFTLELRAPASQGSYNETFQLAVNGKQSVGGALVTLPIRVSAPSGSLAHTTPAGGSSTGQYQTMLLLKSASDLTLSGNGRLALTYGFKNTGKVDWNRLSLRIAGVMPALSGKLSNVQDESWYSSIEPVVSTKTTKPGEIGFVAFTIKAPAKMGKYVASFHLYADNQPVDDGVLDIPITVTADGYIDPVSPTPIAMQTTSGTSFLPQPLSGEEANLPAEPMIRVGLFATTDNQMIVRSASQPFSLQADGAVVCTFTAGESVTVLYDRVNKLSRASGPRCTSQSSSIYIAVADDGLSPLELTDYSRPVSWLPSANDNKFRGKLELRYTPSTDSVWIINELPVEWYLKGMAETSNSSPQEYQKALLTAARTYAMYHVYRGTKHANESYTVDAKYDQVYRGYGAEIRDSNVVAGIDATRGQIVTYNGQLAITPYYSRSDGRTRSWEEVWGGGPKPWLKAVQVPWDAGKTLWGHGVGMSATGALGMAADGRLYPEILKHFYTGTELRRAYK